MFVECIVETSIWSFDLEEKDTWWSQCCPKETIDQLKKELGEMRDLFL